jgi:hypothetical protein
LVQGARRRAAAGCVIAAQLSLTRVSTFMNKFRKLGFIEYNGDLKVHSSLLNVVLYDNPHLRTEGED